MRYLIDEPCIHPETEERLRVGRFCHFQDSKLARPLEKSGHLICHPETPKNVDAVSAGPDPAKVEESNGDDTGKRAKPKRARYRKRQTVFTEDADDSDS